MCPYFCSCVILREITRCPPKNPYFLFRTKICKKAVLSFGLFQPSEFYILHPRTHTLIRRERKWMTWSQDGTRTRDLSAVSHRTKYQLFHLTYRKNWWTRYSSSVWVNLYHFSIFLRDFHFEVNVNLLTNRTLFSFKIKKFVTNYPLPTDFS